MKKRVIARLFIKPEAIEAFKKQAGVIVQKTRKEKGCIFYSLFEEAADPGNFLFYEEYESQEALDIHSHSEYLEAFRTAVKDMHSKDKIVEVF